MLIFRITLKSGKCMDFCDVHSIRVGKLKLVVDYEESSYSVNLDLIADTWSEFERIS